MRYIDAMNMNVSKLQAEFAERPTAVPFLVREFMKCQGAIAQYNGLRKEWGLDGES